MNANAVPASNRAELRDFAYAVDRSRFCRLRQREGAGLRRLDEPARKPLQRLLETVGSDLAPLPCNSDQLGSTGEELRRAAFVVVDVRLFVTEYRIPRAGQR